MNERTWRLVVLAGLTVSGSVGANPAFAGFHIPTVPFPQLDDGTAATPLPRVVALRLTTCTALLPEEPGRVLGHHFHVWQLSECNPALPISGCVPALGRAAADGDPEDWEALAPGEADATGAAIYPDGGMFWVAIDQPAVKGRWIRVVYLCETGLPLANYFLGVCARRDPSLSVASGHQLLAWALSDCTHTPLQGCPAALQWAAAGGQSSSWEALAAGEPSAGGLSSPNGGVAFDASAGTGLMAAAVYFCPTNEAATAHAQTVCARRTPVVFVGPNHHHVAWTSSDCSNGLPGPRCASLLGWAAVPGDDDHWQAIGPTESDNAGHTLPSGGIAYNTRNSSIRSAISLSGLGRDIEVVKESLRVTYLCGT